MVREVIEKRPLAHLTTLNPNGSPQVTVVWVGIEGEEFVMGHLAMHQKVKNTFTKFWNTCGLDLTKPTKRYSSSVSRTCRPRTRQNFEKPST